MSKIDLKPHNKELLKQLFILTACSLVVILGFIAVLQALREMVSVTS